MVAKGEMGIKNNNQKNKIIKIRHDTKCKYINPNWIIDEEEKK